MSPPFLRCGLSEGEADAALIVVPAGVGLVRADPGWAKGLRVQVGGSGVVAHTEVVVPRLLADRVGLTGQLRGVLARAWAAIVAENDGDLPPVRIAGRPLVRPGVGDGPLAGAEPKALRYRLRSAPPA